MFFIPALISVASFVTGASWQRSKSRWRGIPKDMDGVNYEYKLKKYRTPGLSDMVPAAPTRIAVKAPELYDFEFKRETWVDRFFKWLGLSRKYQVGRSNFDDAIYIASDDSGLCRALMMDQLLR